MDVLSFCPLRVSGFTWQPSVGAFTQTVVVKGTFRLLPGESVLADAQEAPSELDNAPYKPKADVVLVGHAYAPGKQPARSWMSRLMVGEIDKSIEVWCDRVFRWQDGTLLEGPRITKMPLLWERAAGGPETGNPVGMRFDAAPDRYGMVPIPNLQPAGMFVSSRADTFAPIGFGPIAWEWPRTGVQPSKLEPGWRERPFPPHFNYGYFQLAPPDQQVAAIRANERIILEKLHAEHDRLVTNLPGMTPRAVLDRATGEREEVRLSADTLWIDTDRGTCSVVWRGRVALRHATEAGRIAVWLEGMPHVTPTQSSGSIANELTGTTALTSYQEKRAEPALPFTPGISKLAETDKRRLVEELSQWVGRGAADHSGTLFAPMANATGKALPFEAADDDEDLVQTLLPAPKMTDVPFVAPPLPVAPIIEAHVGQPEKPGPLPAPPPMIGPLATAEMVAKSESGEAETGVIAIDDAVREALDQAKPIEAEPLPLEKYPLERCAAIAASIARRKGERGRILDEEGLTLALWEELDAHWLATIDAEVDQGGKKMLSAYDEAYVGRLEKERGPITADEYAGLLLAGERRNGAAELRRLGLPEGVMMRIRRVWMGRSVKGGR